MTRGTIKSLQHCVLNLREPIKNSEPTTFWLLAYYLALCLSRALFIPLQSSTKEPQLSIAVSLRRPLQVG